MEKAKLITRHAHESDRRARRVRMEESGRKHFAAAFEIAGELQQRILTAIPASRRGVFLRDLEAIADACVNVG